MIRKDKLNDNDRFILEDSVGALTKRFTLFKDILFGYLKSIDEDAMGSDSSVHVPTQQSVKAYVDNKTLTFNSPATLTVNTGGTPVGTGVSDVQTMLDGNIYQLPEVTGTPGFDIEFAWTGITRIKGFAFRVLYVGTSTHQVTFRAYNYNTTVWDVLFEIPASLGYNYRCNQFPASNMANYFDSGGNAKVKIYHDTAGNASHDLYVDYVAIVN